MNRRDLLNIAGLGLLAPAIPGWMKMGFQEPQAGHGQRDLDSEDTPRCPNPFVESTLDRARGFGKPTLVFVVPEDREARWRRQTLFGQFLNFCTNDALLDLSLCEVLCATQADLAVHVPGAAQAQEPLLILVGPRGTVSFAKNDLPAAGTFDWSEDEKYKAQAFKRIAALTKHVHALVAPDQKALRARAAAARDSLGASLLEQVDQAGASGSSLDPTLADNAAAIVRGFTDHGDVEQLLQVSLLRGTEFRIRKGPPFGSQWATSTGCGTDLEDVPKAHPAQPSEASGESVAFACGMGHTPEVSKRFLSFWSNAGGND